MIKATGLVVVPAFKYATEAEMKHLPHPFMLALQDAEGGETMVYHMGREELYKLSDDIRALVCDG